MMQRNSDRRLGHAGDYLHILIAIGHRTWSRTSRFKLNHEVVADRLIYHCFSRSPTNIAFLFFFVINGVVSNGTSVNLKLSATMWSAVNRSVFATSSSLKFGVSGEENGANSLDQCPLSTSKSSKLG